MFEMIFDVGFTFNKIMALFAAIILLALGLALLGNSLYWRFKAIRVKGRIIGVQKKDKCYFAVFEYEYPIGTKRQSRSDSGSDSLKGKETGRSVTLMFFPDDPDNARTVSSFFIPILGVIFLAASIFCFNIGLESLELNWITVLIFLGFLAVAGLKIKKLIKSKDQWETKRAFKARKKQENEKNYGKMENTKDLLSSMDFKLTQRKQESMNQIVTPIMALIGLGLLIGGGYMGQGLSYLENSGLRTDGQVIELKHVRDTSSNNGTSYSYYPIVKYLINNEQSTTFKSKMGSNPPKYSEGDHVTVLYDPNNPTETAMIDNGFWNWLIPSLLCGFGLMFMLISFSTFSKSRKTS